MTALDGATWRVYTPPMPLWAFTRAATRCGGCSLELPEGVPVALITAAKLLRCEYCAAQLGFSRDEAALADAAFDETGAEAARLEAEARVGVLVPQRRLHF